MLDGFKRSVAARAGMSLLRSLAESKDTQTTVVGMIAGAVIAVPGFDLAKILAGDAVQIAHLAAGLAVALLGLLATRESADGKATLVGTVAGALYAMSGTVEAVTVGVVMAVLGYFTGKPSTGAGE